MMDSSNRHPADQLSEVRSSIRALEEEEAKLRSYLLHHPDDLVGAEYTAVVSARNYKRVDLESLREEVGDAVIRRHTSATPVTFVRLKERREDAA